MLISQANVENSHIYTRKNVKSNIMPVKSGQIHSTILPSKIERRTIKSPPIQAVVTLGIFLMIAIWGVGYSQVRFKEKFEGKWERIEDDNGNFYELDLEIDDGKIDYSMDSWLLDSNIAIINYKIVFAGKVKIGYDEKDYKLYSVKIDDDRMEIIPALTSSEEHEYWYK